MNYRTTQPNFSRGERGPQLRGRFDADLWQASVETAKNVFILKYGGLAKRPGTMLVAEVLDRSAPNRLVPFQFSDTQTYALEMGQGYMAPLSGGGRILQEELVITGITTGPEAVVTSPFHGWSVGNKIWLRGIAGEMGDLLNNRTWEVIEVVSADEFRIEADTRGLTFESASGGIERTTAPDPDPVDPVVPPVVTPPQEPDTGGGGGGGFGGRSTGTSLEEF